MKNLIAAFLIFALSFVVFAQTPHTVTLSWADTQNPAGTTYNVYRSVGQCSGSPVFSKLASAIAVKTAVDNTVNPGTFCYQVTAVLAGAESVPSNTVNPSVQPFPPSGLQFTVARIDLVVPESSGL